MKPAYRWLVLAGLLLATLAARLCHRDIIWVEEAYPAAAAIQMSQHGKQIYQDFWFDKPPGAAYFYRLFDAQPGIPLRIAGTLFVFACALLAYATALRAWQSEPQALAAAALLTFFLIFDHPAAVMAIAPDLLMVLPHLAVLYFVISGRFALAGVACGVAFWINPKAVCIAVACIAWTRSPVLALTAVVTGVAGIAPFWTGWYEQVLLWGRAYSADPPAASPLWEGLKQTGSWLWFHLTLVLAAAVAVTRDRRWRWAWVLSLALAGAAVGLGLRFYPRYFFQLLPLVVLLAARGLWQVPLRVRWALCALLLIPAVRFGRQYPQLAADLFNHREHQWNQLALFHDSRDAAAKVLASASKGETIFVWGYRPDILMLTRMPLGDPYLDSQPINGVLADRHLVSSSPSMQPRPREMQSAFIVDGLGLLNPALAFRSANYREFARTRYSILYRRIQ